MSKRRAVLTEVVQFVPLLTFAAPFVLAGAVDLSAAGSSFALAGVLAVVLTGGLVATSATLNPILVGVNVWLVVGAAAFGGPFEALEAAYVSQQAVTLFVGIAGVGLVQTLVVPGGFIGSVDLPPEIARRASLALVAVALVALAWSWCFEGEIRVGGALPFIALNAVRRAMLRRLLRVQVGPVA